MRERSSFNSSFSFFNSVNRRCTSRISQDNALISSCCFWLSSFFFRSSSSKFSISALALARKKLHSPFYHSKDNFIYLKHERNDQQSLVLIARKTLHRVLIVHSKSIIIFSVRDGILFVLLPLAILDFRILNCEFFLRIDDIQSD